MTADDADVRAGLSPVHPNQWPDRAAPFHREAILACNDAMIDPRDFDPKADVDILPPIAAGTYIAGNNRRNFSHYEADSR